MILHMIYDQKINWRESSKGMGIAASKHDPFRSAIIDYHTEMSVAISDLINLHFRNPKAYDVEGAPFQIQIKIAKALIGPTPMMMSGISSKPSAGSEICWHIPLRLTQKKEYGIRNVKGEIS